MNSLCNVFHQVNNFLGEFELVGVYLLETQTFLGTSWGVHSENSEDIFNKLRNFI